jgi:hypothetical protein
MDNVTLIRVVAGILAVVVRGSVWRVLALLLCRCRENNLASSLAPLEASWYFCRTSTSLHKLKARSPYCSDPKCIYCQELREAHAQIQNGKPITSSGKSVGL